MDFTTLSNQLPFVQLKTSENGIVEANFNGAWMGVVNDEVLKIMRNYNSFLEKNRDSSFISSNRDKYLIVCTDGERFVSKSKSDLLSLKIEKGDQFAYVGLLGYDPTDLSNFTCLPLSNVLALGPCQKPVNFDDWSSRPLFHSHTLSFVRYIAGTRRWVTLCMELENNEWRHEHFLLDTGAPHSFLWRPFLKDLRGVRQLTRTAEPIVDSITCQIEGETIELHITDSKHPDSRLHGINILGTDFLNEFVIVDDFMTAQCMLLKRFKKEKLAPVV